MKRLSFNYRRGFKRLWVIGTIAWFVYVIAVSAYPISLWIGYQVALIKEPGSMSSAIEKEKKFEQIVIACRATISEVCWTDDPEASFGKRRIPSCEQTEAFNHAFNQEAKARGIEVPQNGLNGKVCPDLVDMKIPKIAWEQIFVVISAPMLPLIAYLVCLWVIKGFQREKKVNDQ